MNCRGFPQASRPKPCAPSAQGGGRFLFHRRRRKGGPLPDYISSAGITVLAHGHDSTSRKDVLRRVVIPVVPGATIRTRPYPGRKGELCEQVAAVGAGLARRIEPVDHYQPSSAPTRLVLQLTPELTPGCILNRLCQTPVLDHVRGREVLDDDHVMLAHQPCGGPVQVIGTGVADFAVRGGYLLLGLGPILTTRPAAGHPPLVPGKVPRFALQVLRVSDPLAIAHDSEILKPQVNPDHTACWSERRWICGLERESHIPSAVLLKRDDHHRRVQLDGIHIGERPHELKWRACFRQEQFTVTRPEPRSREVGGLATIAALELRMPRTAGVEVRERNMLMPQYLLQRYRRHLVEERELVGLLPAGQRTIRLGIRRGLPFRRGPDLTLGERPVPHQADTAERSPQQRLLLRARVCPAPIRHSHPYSLSGEDLARSDF